MKHIRLLYTINKKQKGIAYSEHGFILVFAIFLSSIVLTMTISMTSVLYKGLILAASDRESQKAFFAADIGMECALYYDLNAEGGNDADASKSIFFFENRGDTMLNGALCGNREITQENNFYDAASTGYSMIDIDTGAVASGSNQNTATTFFVRSIGWEGGGGYQKTLPCAQVVVTKMRGLTPTTQIESHGFNVCDPNGARRVERAIEFSY